MASYNIVLAEDYLPLRQIIKNIVQETGEFTVAGEANDVQEVLSILEHSRPDMVITDIRLGELKATLKIKELYPQVKVVILTIHREKDYLDQAMTNGVEGYILKQDLDQELFSGIQAVRRGEVYISHSMNPLP
ncbi:MAG: response regulator transcription factor [Desulfobaccales bacterium]|jgi:DNA-binding NarL/FixJ family response regulator